MAHLQTPLKESLKTTKKFYEKLETKGLHTVQDFLLYIPRAYEDLSEIRSTATLQPDQKNILRATVKKIWPQRTKTGKTITFIRIGDEFGDIDCVYFRPHIARSLSIGGDYIFHGKFTRGWGGKAQLVSPTVDPVDQNRGAGGLAAVYIETTPLTSRWIRGKISDLLPLAHDLPDILPDHIRNTEDLMHFGEAIIQLHQPTDEETLAKAKKTVAFSDVFTLQRNALLRKQEWQKESGKSSHSTKLDPDWLKKTISKLPFTLTDDQKITLFEILRDCEHDASMNRLLVGDVGSGKTIVALLALLHTVKN